MASHLTRIVRNKSSRNGVTPRLIVLHTTEGHERPGVVDLESLASWFDNPATKASAHVGNDNEGNDIRMVADSDKAWACAGYNSLSLNLEQIGLAAETRADWLAQPKQLANTAQWVRFWADKYHIPVQKGKVSGNRLVRPGVVQHSDLGVIGGGHHDCGVGFPFDLVLQMAIGVKRPTQVDKWKARLARLRADVRRVGHWTPGREKLAKALERDIKNHTKK